MAEERSGTMAKVTPNFIEVVGGWPMSRKISLGVVALLSMVVFAVIIMQARVADHELLFANMAETDASEAISWLKAQKIPYKLENNGKNIYVPADRVHEARIDLAGAGLPKGGGVGFEIFDKQSFGMTDFTQKINYQRALQGELARTISSLSPVEAARVMLALPKKSLFKEDEVRPTASVILKLVPGKQLREDQIAGITQLVAGSIEGLDAADVSVIDAAGRMLNKKKDYDSPGGATPGMLSFQQEVERSLERRAQSLLDKAFGINNTLVRVTAKVDFSRVEKTQELYDPEKTAARSEQLSEEKSGSPQSEGAPGVESNLQNNRGSGGAIATSRKTETTNYEISKTISRTVEPVGGLKLLSVSVLVADKVVQGKKGAAPTHVPRDAKEMQTISNMVKSALGIDENRGDQVTVVSMPIEDDITKGMQGSMVSASVLQDVLPYLRYLFLIAAGVMAYLFLLRPLLRSLTATKTERIVITSSQQQQQQQQHRQQRTDGQPEELPLQEGLAPLPEKKVLPVIELEDPMEMLRNQIVSSGATATHVVREWLNAER